MRLEMVRVCAGYGGADVLHDLSFGVDAGELVGLLGPNGCGKSTALRVLSHVLVPSSGAVRLDSASIDRLSRIEIARRIAFVPQQESAGFEFSVRDVVLMGRYPHLGSGKSPGPADYALADRALAAVDLARLADRSITQLSGGEHRRALLARALVQEAPLLLLDEPTAYLDITHQAEMLALVQAMVRDRTVGAIAALHDLNAAAEFCDRLILMRSGRVIAEGFPDQVLTPDNLRLAYDAAAQVAPNAATGRPIVLTVRPARSAGPPADSSSPK
jgi:iron complex transport system ATP-binding protein